MGGSIEEPSYETLRVYGGFEVRRYGNTVQARLRTAGTGWNGTSNGFRRIASYIFGGNHADQRIAMTAPVQMWENDEGPMMSFTMPSEYSIGDLPDPLDPEIKLTEVKEHTVAVLSFSRLSRSGKARRLMTKLRSMAEAQGLTPVGNPVLAVYDNPGTTLPLHEEERDTPTHRVAKLKITCYSGSIRVERENRFQGATPCCSVLIGVNERLPRRPRGNRRGGN